MRKSRINKGLESRISGILKPGESVVIIGTDGQKKTLSAAGAVSSKPMASTRSVNDLAGIDREMRTGKHSVHREGIEGDKVRISGKTREGGKPGSVVLTTAEYLRHCAKEVNHGLKTGSFFIGDGNAVVLAEHIK